MLFSTNFDGVMRKLILFYGIMSRFCVALPDVRYLHDSLFIMVESPSHLEYAYEIMTSEAVGTPFPKHPHYGIPVVLADPLHACLPLQNIYLDGRAVLAIRGHCPFTMKVKNIEEGGGILALIFDNDSRGVELVDMIGDEHWEKPEIPAAFMTGASGFRWMEYLKEQPGNMIPITVPLNYTMKTLFNIGVSKPPWELW